MAYYDRMSPKEAIGRLYGVIARPARILDFVSTWLPPVTANVNTLGNPLRPWGHTAWRVAIIPGILYTFNKPKTQNTMDATVERFRSEYESRSSLVHIHRILSYTTYP